MNKQDFIDILTKYTPSELNQFIADNGKKKPVNAIIFIKENKKENKNGSK